MGVLFSFLYFFEISGFETHILTNCSTKRENAKENKFR